MHKFSLKWRLFSILNFGLKRPKNVKKSPKGPHDDNKFCILDGAKHDPKNFSIYITSFQSMAFCIFFFGTKHPKSKTSNIYKFLGLWRGLNEGDEFPKFVDDIGCSWLSLWQFPYLPPTGMVQGGTMCSCCML